jgi:hypothetical protein
VNSGNSNKLFENSQSIRNHLKVTKISETFRKAQKFKIRENSKNSENCINFFVILKVPGIPEKFQEKFRKPPELQNRLKEIFFKNSVNSENSSKYIGNFKSFRNRVKVSENFQNLSEKLQNFKI